MTSARNGDDTPLFGFVAEIAKQAKYALFAFDDMEAADLHRKSALQRCTDATKAGDEAGFAAAENEAGEWSDRIAYSLQAFVVSTALISRLLWSHGLKGDRWPDRKLSGKDRLRLREALKVEGESALMSRRTRNFLEHVEGVLIETAERDPDHPGVDMAILGGKTPADPLTLLFGVQYGERQDLGPLVEAVRNLRSASVLKLAELEEELGLVREHEWFGRR